MSVTTVGTTAVGRGDGRGTTVKGAPVIRGDLAVGVAERPVGGGPVESWSTYLDHLWHAEDGNADLNAATSGVWLNRAMTWTDRIAGSVLRQYSSAYTLRYYSDAGNGRPGLKGTSTSAQELLYTDAPAICELPKDGNPCAIYTTLYGASPAQRYAASFGNSADNDSLFCLRDESANQTSSIFRNDAGSSQSSAPLAGTAYRHVLMASDGSTIKVYVNGSLAYTSGVMGSVPHTFNRFALNCLLRGAITSGGLGSYIQAAGLVGGAKAATLHTDPTAFFAWVEAQMGAAA